MPTLPFASPSWPSSLLAFLRPCPPLSFSFLAHPLVTLSKEIGSSLPKTVGSTKGLKQWVNDFYWARFPRLPFSLNRSLSPMSELHVSVHLNTLGQCTRFSSMGGHTLWLGQQKGRALSVVLCPEISVPLLAPHPSGISWLPLHNSLAQLLSTLSRDLALEGSPRQRHTSLNFPMPCSGLHLSLTAKMEKVVNLQSLNAIKIH